LVHKKYIKKGGKTFGPYLYETKRVNGKVVTTYVGKPKKDSRKITLPHTTRKKRKKEIKEFPFYFIIGLLAVVVVLGFAVYSFETDYNFQVSLSPEEVLGFGDGEFFDFIEPRFIIENFRANQKKTNTLEDILGGVGIFLQPDDIHYIGACQDLSGHGDTYILTDSFTAGQDPCFTVLDNDITLDGNFNKVTGSGVAIDNNPHRYEVTIKNIELSGFARSYDAAS